MMKKRCLTLAVAALALLALPWASAQAGIFVNIGIPGPWYGPYYHRHYYYYGPRVVVAAPPVVDRRRRRRRATVYVPTADRNLHSKPPTAARDHHGLAADGRRLVHRELARTDRVASQNLPNADAPKGHALGGCFVFPAAAGRADGISLPATAGR